MATIRGFPDRNVVACFVEPNTSGSISDWNAGRNAPLRDPSNYLTSVVFHSSFFQYEIASGPTNVTINHTSLAGQTISYGYAGDPITGGGAIGFSVAGDIRVTNILLVTHSLGYVPKFMVSLDGRRVPDGGTIQTQGNGVRRISVHADSTRIWLRETAISGAQGTTLSSTSRTYRVFVFRNSSPQTGQPLFGMSSGNLILARGVINSSRSYLRRVGSGDSPFALNLGRTIDIDNGGVRNASGGVVVTDSNYDGSFSAPDYVSVGVN